MNEQQAFETIKRYLLSCKTRVQVDCMKGVIERYYIRFGYTDYFSLLDSYYYKMERQAKKGYINILEHAR